MTTSSARDWYKDAVFYEVHVKAYKDGNGDGIGDFAGLTESLDYIQELGVDCLWILPMYRRRSGTTGTTSRTSTRSIPRTATSRTSRSSSTPPTSAGCASSPTWS
jgi:hypothetical protein